MLGWRAGGLDYLINMSLARSLARSIARALLTNDTTLYETGGKATFVSFSPSCLLDNPLMTGQSFLKQLLLFLSRLPLFSPADKILLK